MFTVNDGEGNEIDIVEGGYVYHENGDHVIYAEWDDVSSTIQSQFIALRDIIRLNTQAMIALMISEIPVECKVAA